ncbi:His-Xaa-Ser system radical SAM maturase HxsC [Salmonella phage 19]|nr:His-Xaa-Ser system radical SAM maturase HxsC [Salmonella phage 19]
MLRLTCMVMNKAEWSYSALTMLVSVCLLGNLIWSAANGLISEWLTFNQFDN